MEGEGKEGGRKGWREEERERVGEKRKRWSMVPPFPPSPYKIKAILLEMEHKCFPSSSPKVGPQPLHTNTFP